MSVIAEIFSYTYQRPEDEIDRVDWSSDGKWIVCGTIKGRILVVEAASGKEKVTYQIGTTSFWALEWFPDNQHLLVCFEDMIMVWNAWNGERHLLYHHGVRGRETPFSVGQRSSDGLLVASSAYGKESPTVQVHEVKTGNHLATFRPRELFDELQEENAEAGLPVYYPPFYPLCWSPKGTYIALGQDYKVHVWESATDQRVFFHSVASIPETGERIEDFAWSPDEQCLAFAREERHAYTPIAQHIIEVWNWEARERWSIYRGHTNAVLFIQWLAGKDQIVSVSTNELHVWDTRTGMCIARSVLPVADECRVSFTSAVLSPNCSQLALVGTHYLPNTSQEGVFCVWQHGLEL